MDIAQISTNTANGSTVVDKKSDFLLSALQDEYISYVAVGGLVPEEDGPGKRMTAGEFALRAGVERTTLYFWRKSIPGFWDLVNERRKEIGGKDRLSKVWNGIYLKACAGHAEPAKLFLANFDPNFRMPTEKMEHDIGTGMADLIANIRRNEQPERKIIDAEISDPKPE